MGLTPEEHCWESPPAKSAYSKRRSAAWAVPFAFCFREHRTNVKGNRKAKVAFFASRLTTRYVHFPAGDDLEHFHDKRPIRILLRHACRRRFAAAKVALVCKSKMNILVQKIEG